MMACQNKRYFKWIHSGSGSHQGHGSWGIPQTGVRQSQRQEKLGKATEILRECGADGWAEKYEKERVALS